MLRGSVWWEREWGRVLQSHLSDWSLKNENQPVKVLPGGGLQTPSPQSRSSQDWKPARLEQGEQWEGRKAGDGAAGAQGQERGRGLAVRWGAQGHSEQGRDLPRLFICVCVSISAFSLYLGLYHLSVCLRICISLSGHNRPCVHLSCGERVEGARPEAGRAA